MTKAADLIEALLARKPGRLILERRSGMPYAWGIWMRARRVDGMPFDDAQLVTHMQTLPPRPAPAAARPPSFLQALRQLWWQQWDPPPRDERPLRWLAALASFLIHVLFLLLLICVVAV
ncbi:MAG TPA: transmembrane repetitive protein, partial [Xanthomonadaceae bacterium]|nr:transmembrane repetitive protein [Xanthomonadaceae bacterium]